MMLAEHYLRPRSLFRLYSIWSDRIGITVPTINGASTPTYDRLPVINVDGREL